MKTANMNIHVPVIFTTKSEGEVILTIYCQCLTVLNHKPIIKPKVSIYKPISYQKTFCFSCSGLWGCFGFVFINAMDYSTLENYLLNPS